MSDLKLLDELLIDYMRTNDLQPEDLESHSSVTREAISRLRSAHLSGEMPVITLTWATYFERTANELSD